jgi:hypothetical protein
MTGFSAQVFQNEFLPPGSSEVHAVVTVTSTGGPGSSGAGTGEAAVVIAIDTSGSMEGSRIREARRAVAAALEEIRDGVWFAVVAGYDKAHIVFPRPETPGNNQGMVRADAATRSAAQELVRQLQAKGGTAISTWLDAAGALLQAKPGAIHHAIVVTDGKNESEPPGSLHGALQRWRGVYTADCRGVGQNWVVEELRLVASALLGTVDIIPEPHEMAAEFQALMAKAMGKAVASVELRVWVPQHAELMFVKQVAPDVADLTASAQPGPNPLTRDFPTGSWGAEERDYQVAVRVKAGNVGDEMLAARVSLVIDDQPVSQGLVKAIWSQDERLTARINPEVAHYTGQVELAQAITEGLAAREAGDVDTATARLGRAVQLAAEAGNEGTTRLLAKVVDIENSETGTVRLKRNVEQLDVMTLDTRSTKTARVRPAQPVASDPPDGAPAS